MDPIVIDLMQQQPHFLTGLLHKWLLDTEKMSNDVSQNA